MSVVGLTVGNKKPRTKRYALPTVIDEAMLFDQVMVKPES